MRIRRALPLLALPAPLVVGALGLVVLRARHTLQREEVSAPHTGSASDLETRIDEPALTMPTIQASSEALKAALHTATLKGMMTVDRNGNGTTNGVWTPFASAVVLWSRQDWDTRAMQDAVRQLVEQKLTAGGLGTAWRQTNANGFTYFAMSDAHGLQMAVSGQVCIVADNAALLMEMMQRQQKTKAAKGRPATILAGFDHDAGRDAFARWTAVVDGLDQGKNGSAAAPAAADAATGESPAFFGNDMNGLSHAFAAMQREQFVARQDGGLTRQTITYSWQH